MNAIGVTAALSGAPSPSGALHSLWAIAARPAVFWITPAEPTEESATAVEVPVARLVDATESDANLALEKYGVRGECHSDQGRGATFEENEFEKL
jgi:hypothetical protein